MTTTQDAPVSTSVDALLSAGDRFRFRGLPGQEAHPSRLPGSGSLGWLIEVLNVGPFGQLAVRCWNPESADLDGRVSGVGLADATAMIRAGVWERVAS